MQPRVYEDKLCTPGKLLDEIVSAGVTIGSRFFGVYYSSGENETIVQVADDLTQQEGTIIDNAVNSHTPTSALDIAKDQATTRMKTEIEMYLFSKYDQGTQSSMNAFFIEGVSNSWTNRKALVQSVLDWIKSVLSYYYGKKDDIAVATTVEQVNAITWDFFSFDATDPKVALQTVKETTN